MTAPETPRSRVPYGTAATGIHRFRLMAGFMSLALVALACGGGTATQRPASVAPITTPEASEETSPEASEGTESPTPTGDESPEASPPGGESPGPSGSPTGNEGEIAVTLQPPATGGALQLWNPFTGPDGPLFLGIVEDFNAETPQCQVTVATKPGAEYVANLEAAASANQLPHVIAAGFDGLPGLAENQIVTPIDDLAEQAGFDETQFPEAIWNAGVWKDQRYGIPIDTHPMLFYYNKALFEQAGLDPESPPTDQASFEAAITAINDNTEADGYQMVSTGPGANFLVGIQFASLFYQGGGQWTSDDLATATYNDQAGVQAAEYLAHLVNDLGVPKVESDAEINAFQQGDNGMVMSGIWESSRYLEALGDDLGVAPVPEIFGPGAWGGSHNLAVTSAASDPEIRGCAYYFIDWFSAHSFDWGAAGQVPARNAVREQIVNATDNEGLLAVIAAVAPLAESVQFPPNIPGIGEMITGAQGAGEAATLVINGSSPAQEALDASVEYNSGVLQANKDRYGY